MKPENTRVWRKTRREALKGVSTGRRTTHQADPNDPIPGSTWSRRQRAKTPPGLFSRIGGEAR